MLSFVRPFSALHPSARLEDLMQDRKDLDTVSLMTISYDDQSFDQSFVDEHRLRDGYVDQKLWGKC